MKRIVLILCCLVAPIQTRGEQMPAFYYGDVGPPGPNGVHIGKIAIVMPLGRIFLVRKDFRYCAAKFTEFWTGKTEEDLYARYESYYQGDGTGDFSKKNIQFKEEQLSFPKPRGIGRLKFSFGNREVKCGPIRLFWDGEGALYFYKERQDEGDYGIELSPTKWTDISEVNVFDSRLKWYRYDGKRKEVNIPIDRLWDDKQK